VSQVRGAVYRHAQDARGGYGYAVPVYGWDAWTAGESGQYGEWVWWEGGDG
jgi:hypothetical protein